MTNGARCPVCLVTFTIQPDHNMHTCEHCHSELRIARDLSGGIRGVQVHQRGTKDPAHKLACPKCQYPNRATAQFCGHCAAPMTGARKIPGNTISASAHQTDAVTATSEPLVCPRCQHSNRPDAHFCTHCGISLAHVITALSDADTPFTTPDAADPRQGNPLIIGLALLLFVIVSLAWLTASVHYIASGNVLVGIWNIAMTSINLGIVDMLAKGERRGYNLAVAMALGNNAFVCMQMQLFGMYFNTVQENTTAEVTVDPLDIAFVAVIIITTTVLAVYLLLMRNWITPPLRVYEVELPYTIEREVNVALEQGKITAHERALYIATYKHFVSHATRRRTGGVEFNQPSDYARIDVVIDQFAITMGGGAQERYLFRPVIEDADIDWFKRMFWGRTTVIICIDACEAAFSKRKYKLYALRYNKKNGRGVALGYFRQTFKNTPMAQGKLPPDDHPHASDRVGP